MYNVNFTVSSAQSEIPIFSYRADTDGSFLHIEEVCSLISKDQLRSLNGA